MRPVSVFANGPDSEIERLRAELRGPWRQAAPAVMVLLSRHELTAAQIAGLLECHPGTARRWIARFNAGGLAGLADRPGTGGPGSAGGG
ncbi:MAG: helix-turn-helix domain-containing protein [Pseudonocardiaceae bacterium]